MAKTGIYTNNQVSIHSEKDVNKLEQMICSYDWDCSTALAIARAESGLNASTLNDNPKTGDYSVGLFQINLYGNLAKTRPSEAWLKKPQNNIQYAYTMWQHSGFKCWSTYKTGAYKKHLN